MSRRVSVASDHLAIIDAAIAAIPAKWRKNLLITIDGAGSSHDLVDHLTKLNARPGWSVVLEPALPLRGITASSSPVLSQNANSG